MKKKVIFFIPSNCGGAERQAIVISRCLDDETFDVSYHIFGPKNQLQKFIPANRKLIFHYEPKFTHNLISNMRNVIKAEKPDVVYGAEMPVNWRLVIAAIGCKCKIILRNDNYLYTQNFLQKFRLALTYPFANYIIAQTDEMRNGMIAGLHLRKSLVQTVSNAIDKQYIAKCILDKNPYNNDKHTRFVAVGRFNEIKGFDMLVRAFKIVKTQLPNAELYIVGDYKEDNPVYQDINKFVLDNGLNGSVYCTGFKDNPYVYMQNADCYVLSSRNEGLPNVMIEALYLGTPVAAFKCIPVIERIISEGRSGFLASKENIEELGEAMLKACKLGRIQTSYAADTESVFREIFFRL